MTNVEYVLVAVTGITVPVLILILGWLIRVEAKLSNLEGKIDCVKKSLTG